jgi:hypothetical protein
VLFLFTFNDASRRMGISFRVVGCVKRVEGCRDETRTVKSTGRRAVRRRRKARPEISDLDGPEHECSYRRPGAPARYRAIVHTVDHG